MMTQVLGFAAANLTTFAFLPQLLKIWQTRSTQDISMPMLVTFIAGVTLWLVYGLMISSPPLIIANFLTLAFNLVILRFKLIHG